MKSTELLKELFTSIPARMLELRGPALLATVTTLTSLGFLMIGYDNGLFGGLGTPKVPRDGIAKR